MTDGSLLRWRVLRAIVLLASLVTFGLTTAGPAHTTEAAVVLADVVGHERTTRVAPGHVERRRAARPLAPFDVAVEVGDTVVRPGDERLRPVAPSRPDDGPPRGPPSRVD